MSKTARTLFERRARQYGDVDLSIGIFGEWLSPHTRRAWFFFYSAWKDRAKDIKKRTGMGKVSSEEKL